MEKIDSKKGIVRVYQKDKSNIYIKDLYLKQKIIQRNSDEITNVDTLHMLYFLSYCEGELKNE